MLERFYSLTTKYPLDVITHFFILIPLVAGLVCFPQLKRDMRLVLLFFLVDFIMETVALFSMLKGGTTMFIADIRASLNIVLVAVIYYEALVRMSQKRLVASSGSLFCLFSIFVYSADSGAPWSQTAFRVYAMGAALTYYNAILADLNLKKIHHHSMFWFTAGLLFYTCGTLFSTLFNQYLLAEDTPDTLFDSFTYLNQALYITFCLLATVGFRISKLDKENYFERDYFRDNFL